MPETVHRPTGYAVTHSSDTPKEPPQPHAACVGLTLLICGSAPRSLVSSCNDSASCCVRAGGSVAWLWRWLHGTTVAQAAWVLSSSRLLFVWLQLIAGFATPRRTCSDDARATNRCVRSGCTVPATHHPQQQQRRCQSWAPRMACRHGVHGVGMCGIAFSVRASACKSTVRRNVLCPVVSTNCFGLPSGIYSDVQEVCTMLPLACTMCACCAYGLQGDVPGPVARAGIYPAAATAAHQPSRSRRRGCRRGARGGGHQRAGRAASGTGGAGADLPAVHHPRAAGPRGGVFERPAAGLRGPVRRVSALGPRVAPLVRV